jgi:hypothetical protein
VMNAARMRVHLVVRQPLYLRRLQLDKRRGPDAVALEACRSQSWGMRCRCRSKPHLRHY